jgi:hypothetical protein
MKNIFIFLTAMFIIVTLNVTTYSSDGMKYEVTVTNLTRGQSFTPILIATHKEGVKLFTPGSSSTDELAILAEGGDTVPLGAMLLSNEKVKDIATSGGLLGPGETVTIEIPSGKGFNYISMASMLIPTNDGFFALNGVKASIGNKKIMHLSPAYDAGSEINDEDCLNIPGPVCGGEGFNPVDGEGYVHIHAGIHGIGGIEAADYDWRNPVARIIIQRVD